MFSISNPGLNPLSREGLNSNGVGLVVTPGEASHTVVVRVSGFVYDGFAVFPS